MAPRPSHELARRLTTADAVTIGLGAMLGTGVFAAAGTWLLVGLALAATVAYANATSSAQLAALYPESGGTYVYARERLGSGGGHDGSSAAGSDAGPVPPSPSVGAAMGTRPDDDQTGGVRWP